MTRALLSRLRLQQLLPTLNRLQTSSLSSISSSSSSSSSSSIRRLSFRRLETVTSAKAVRSFGAAVAVAAGLALSAPSAAAFWNRAPSEQRQAAGAPAKQAVVMPRDRIVLYQYNVCPFCCKVKAFLDYHNVPYTCIEVDPLFKAQMKSIEGLDGYRKVPVAVIDGVVVKDSNTIIDTLSKSMQLPLLQGPAEESERKWRAWVDDKFVKILTVNIYRNMTECFATMDYLSKISEFNVLTRVASQTIGAVMMYFVVALKTKPALKIDDPRDALRSACGDIVMQLQRGGGGNFLGGDSVDRADLAAFGVLRSIEGQDTFKAAMELVELKRWYERVAAAVGQSSRI